MVHSHWTKRWPYKRAPVYIPNYIEPPHCQPAFPAYALSVAGAEVPSGAPRTVDIVALTVSAVDAKVKVDRALAHPSVDAGAASAADHARVLGILATGHQKFTFALNEG